MRNISSHPKWSWLLAALVAGLSCAVMAAPQALAQNARAGRVVGNIDGISFDGGQAYVSGWACLQGNSGSIDVHIYADRSAYDKPPGIFVMAGKAELAGEPAVGQACQDPWNGSYGPTGLYFATSTDLIHWSKPVLAITQNQLLQREPEGNWSYSYFSLIDPKSTDVNYSTVTDSPYLYYVRSDEDHGPYKRVLFRQKIKLDWLAASARNSGAPAGAGNR
jgi:hypothetical protein